MKMAYESPELDVLWFEQVDVIASSKETELIPGDGVGDSGTGDDDYVFG